MFPPGPSPLPSGNQVDASEPGRVYVLFDSEESCKKARDALNGRTFDGNKVVATFVPPDDFPKVQAGEWLAPPPDDEGVVRLRGLAPTTGKVDIATFFAGCGPAPLRDQDVRLLIGPNGQPSGDAYCLLRGPLWTRSLLRNGQVLGGRIVEVAPSSLEVRDWHRCLFRALPPVHGLFSYCGNLGSRCMSWRVLRV